MSYVYLDDAFFDNPKAVRAGGDAQLVYIAGLAFCNRVLTGGLIPVAKVPQLTDRRQPLKLAKRLVGVDLWHEQGHGCPECPDVDAGHYLVHDYEDRNRSAEAKRKEKARKAAEAMHEKRRTRAQADAQADAQALLEHLLEHEPSSAPIMPPARARARIPSSPTPSVVDSSSSTSRLRLVEEEEDFASLVARNRLARRRGQQPIVDTGKWLAKTADNVRSEFGHLAESWEGTQAELAARIDGLSSAQERPAVVERPDCPTCGGTTWLEDENGNAYRCEHGAARAAVGGRG